MYASNPQLATKFIYNIRRSGSMTETITIPVSIETTNAQLDQLATKLNDAIAKDFARDFFANLVVYITALSYETGTMTLELWLEHKNNFQSGTARWGRTTRFRKLLNESIREVGLEPGKSQLIEIAGLSQWYLAQLTSGLSAQPLPAPTPST
jgi:small-conductance mechanosensitive channel